VTLKEKIENNIVFWLLSTAVAGFAAGFSAGLKTILNSICHQVG